MRSQWHPETGTGRQQARESLFKLLIGTLLMAFLIGMLVQHYNPRVGGPGWWISLFICVSFLIVSALALVYWDDHRIGQHTTKIELLVPYLVYGNGKVRLGNRRSYGITNDAKSLWTAAFPSGLNADRRGKTGGTNFASEILPFHMALVRHLLLTTLANFGQRSEHRTAVHGWVRLGVALENLSWGELPELVRDSIFAKSTEKSCPKNLPLPTGSKLEAFDKGELVLRLHWIPPKLLWLGRLRLRGSHLPGGEIRVRWLGPLSEVKSYERKFEHLTVRLPELKESGSQATPTAHVIITRLLIEVETRWNLLGKVAEFRDWAVNLSHYWQKKMDYWTWRDYYLERLIDDLDWKIGWMKKGGASIVERLESIDKRLSSLEAALKNAGNAEC